MVSLAETARRNTQAFVDNRKKVVENLSDRLFTTLAKEIVDYSSKNSVSNMVFNLTDPTICKKVAGLSDTTHQERYDILKKVSEKFQEEKFVYRIDGTVLHVSWEVEATATEIANAH